MKQRAVDSHTRQANAMGAAAADGTLGQRKLPVSRPQMQRGPASQPQVSGARDDGYQPRSLQEGMDRDRAQAEAEKAGKSGDFRRENGMIPIHSTYQSLADKEAGKKLPDGNRTPEEQKQAVSRQRAEATATLTGSSVVKPPAGVRGEVGSSRPATAADQHLPLRKPMTGSRTSAPFAFKRTALGR